MREVDNRLISESPPFNHIKDAAVKADGSMVAVLADPDFELHTWWINDWNDHDLFIVRGDEILRTIQRPPLADIPLALHACRYW